MGMNDFYYFKMTRKLCIGYSLVCLCAVLFLAQTTSAGIVAKAFLVWPASICKGRGASCGTPIPNRFTIETLAATHEDGTTVGKGECSKLLPQNQEPLTEEMLRKNRILDDLKTYWPNLEGPQNTQLDIKNWESQRDERAGCFQKPNGHLSYFKRALDVIKKYNLAEILGGYEGQGDRDSQVKVIPKDDDTYSATLIAHLLGETLEAKPEILCNINKDEIRQFCGAVICFDEDSETVDCSEEFHNCSDDPVIPNDETLKLLFPTARDVNKD